MLTQTQPLNSTSVTIDRLPNGYGVLLAGNLIGNIESEPVWGLDGTQYDTAVALGLSNTDTCYTFSNQVYRTVQQASAMAVGEYLTSTAIWEMPAYT
jgi:hypothetical protein